MILVKIMKGMLTALILTSLSIAGVQATQYVENYQVSMSIDKQLSEMKVKAIVSLSKAGSGDMKLLLNPAVSNLKIYADDKTEIDFSFDVNGTEQLSPWVPGQPVIIKQRFIEKKRNLNFLITYPLQRLVTGKKIF
jgi:hypothetical protein